MAWQDRVKDAVFVSPVSKQRLTFDFENVRREQDKKGTAFNFTDTGGTYIQDKAATGRRYPVRAFFSGDDHDLEATAFENAVAEQGIGTFESPFYGNIQVTVIGRIARRDDLVTAANQSIVELTFFETTGLIYPKADIDPASSVLSSVGNFNVSIAEEFEEKTDIDSAIERASLKNKYTNLLDAAKSGLDSVAKVQNDVNDEFNDVVDSINSGIDILIQKPLTLAFQTAIMLQAPSRALTSIKARLDAYKNLADSIITGDDAVLIPNANDSRVDNEFRVNDLYASTAITGSILSAVNNEFESKEKALTAAEDILTQLDDVTNWRDDNANSLDIIDTGESYQKLQEAVAIAAGFLVEISFSLDQERSIIIDRDRTILDLSAQLYGEDFETKLDFLIKSNDLSGTEYLELKRGREIVYFV